MRQRDFGKRERDSLLSTLAARKLNTLLGLWVTGAAAVLAVYAGCQAELAVALFAISAGLNTLTGELSHCSYLS